MLAGDGHPASPLARVCPWSAPPPSWLTVRDCSPVPRGLHCVTAHTGSAIVVSNLPLWSVYLPLPVVSDSGNHGDGVSPESVGGVWAPRGTTDITTRICRALCTFFARSVTVLWQMSKICGTNLISVQQCMLGYNFHFYSATKEPLSYILVSLDGHCCGVFCTEIPKDLSSLAAVAWWSFTGGQSLNGIWHLTTGFLLCCTANIAINLTNFIKNCIHTIAGRGFKMFLYRAYFIFATSNKYISAHCPSLLLTSSW